MGTVSVRSHIYIAEAAFASRHPDDPRAVPCGPVIGAQQLCGSALAGPHASAASGAA